MRKFFIAGNWKMNKTYDEAVQLAAAVQQRAVNEKKINIGVFVPAPYLRELAMASPDLIVGAQNLYWENAGAFTGEVSPPMLRSLGVSWTLIGHSERRALFGETDEEVNKKAIAALKHCISPIVCVGETLGEREKKTTLDIIGKQVKEAFYNIPADVAATVTLAYEPVWAIGTGKTATPEDAEEVHAYIRMILASLYSTEVSRTIRILYGGSVKPSNAASLLKMKNIDGALIGGASLNKDDFISICDTALTIEKGE
ncbi:triose-phosphate isomerase [Candidatus Mcinerneyibacteriota bacterium]|nr:triose-phosphate isomerase [Candidatus Mcinerneyibacteriota bacterium]